MEKLSLKKIIIQKNVNTVISGQLFVPGSFKIKSPWSWSSKACWLFSAIKKVVWKQTVRKSRVCNDSAVRLAGQPHENTYQFALKKKKIPQ